MMEKTLNLILLLLMVNPIQAQNTARPNIILIMADDMGYGDPSYVNASVLQANGTNHPDQGWIQTPNMDAMASEGIRFDRFYSASAVCSPTRASALTGRNPFRVGVPFANDGHLGEDETPLSEILSAAGYETGHFGKWHLGTMTTLRTDSNRGAPGNTAEYHAPWHFGYDYCFATESKVPTYHPYRVTVNGAALPTSFTMDPTLGYTITDPNFYGTHFWTMPANPATAAEGVVVPMTEVNNATNGDSAKLITDKAVDFITDSVNNNAPFFVVLWYHTPHRPMTDPDGVAGVDSAVTVKAGIEDLDTAIGSLRSELDSLGVRNNTMLWLTSDNGPASSLDSTFDEAQTPIPERTIRSGGLRDRKATFYEGGIRVPGILEWPAVIGSSGSRTNFVSSTSDYYPTILDYLDLSTSNQKALDGISLRPLLEGTLSKRPSPVGFLLGGNKPKSAWITEDYKLIKDNTGDWELYDMNLPDHLVETTPTATESNLSTQSQAIQDIYNEMLTDYNAWKATVDTDTAFPNATTPTTTLTAVTQTSAPFSLTVTFDKPVTGLSISDFAIAGGSASSINGSGTSYTLVVTPSYYGDISINLPQGAAYSTDGTPTLPSNELLVEVTNSLDVNTVDASVSFSGGSHVTVDADDLSPANADNNPDKFDGTSSLFATTLYVRSHGSKSERQVHGLLKFDLSGLDASAIDSATLQLNGYSLNDSQSINLQAIAAGADWSTTPTYTLTTQGAVSNGADISVGLDANLLRDYELDVTDMVASWVNGSETNHGIILQLSSNAVANGVGFQLTGPDAPALKISQVPLALLDYTIIDQSSAPRFHMIYQGNPDTTYYLQKTQDLKDPNSWTTIDQNSSQNNFLNFSPQMPLAPQERSFFRLSTAESP